MGHCAWRAAAVAGLLVPSIAAAQLAPVGVPRGLLRVELDGAIASWDDRFLDGGLQNLAADLASPALGSDRFPALADAEARVGRLIGSPGYRLSLGRLSADAVATVDALTLGVSLGLTRRLAAFGRLPLVRARVQPRLVLDPATADAGFTPDPAAQGDFFAQFDAALATLAAKLAAGDYTADPARRALAEATLASGTALRGDLFGLLGDPATAAPFAPTSISAAGAAIAGQVAGLQQTLSGSLDVPGFTLAPALPATAAGEAEVKGVLTSPAGLALRLDESVISFRGDAEAGAAFTLVDRWDPAGRMGGLRVALAAAVRFPTGRRERPDHPLDLGTGEGQTDIDLSLTADLGGGPWGARLTGGYSRQLPSDVLARVTPPAQPFVGPERLTLVRRDPGDVLRVGVRPFYRLARTLAIQAVGEYQRRGADSYSYASPAAVLPAVDPSVLGADTEATARVVGLGITFASEGSLRPGGRGLPVEASWSLEQVVGATGGRVARTRTVRGGLRIYWRLFD